MKNHAEVWPIEEMAHVLEVSHSGYYQHCKASPSTREKLNVLLIKEIKHTFQ